MEKEQTHKPIRSLPKVLLLAAILIVLDAFVINQGIIALLIGFWLVFIDLPWILFSKRYANRRYQVLRNNFIYFLAVISVFAFNVVNNKIARNRAENLISTVFLFQKDNGSFPDTLTSLIPKYTDSIPIAKFTFFNNRFYYWKSNNSATLMYVSFPPFGRPYYDFGKQKWGYLD